MLTGDKLETATCIAKSSRLVSPNQGMHIMGSLGSRREAHLELNALRRKSDSALIIKVNRKVWVKIMSLCNGELRDELWVSKENENKGQD